MDHYLDIKVQPDLETSAQDLLNNLFAKLHRALGHYAAGRIGVSFPCSDKTLGSVLRLHGSTQDIANLMQQNWLQGLRDYVRCSAVLPVPKAVQYRTVRRVQAKSAHNKRQRSIAKGWLTEQQAFEQIPDTQQKSLRLPFIQLRSLSNGNTMRIYIQHGELREQAQLGSFSAYGLSSSTTIPWF